MGLGLAFKMLINQTSSNRDFIGNDRASRYAGSCVHDDNIFDCIAINLINRDLYDLRCQAGAENNVVKPFCA